MSLSLLFSRRQRKSVRIGAIELDAALSEEHSWESKVTEYPTEDGASISDHIFNLPRKIAIEGFVTNSPVVIFSAFTDIDNADRVQSAVTALQELRDTRELVSVITGLVAYENMALVSLDIPRDASTGQALRFRASFVEVKKVSLDTVDIPTRKVSRSGAASKVNTGKQTPPKAPAAVEDSGSLLYRLLK